MNLGECLKNRCIILFILVNLEEFEKGVNSGGGGDKKRKTSTSVVCGMMDIIIKNQSKNKQKSMKKKVKIGVNRGNSVEKCKNVIENV